MLLPSILSPTARPPKWVLILCPEPVLRGEATPGGSLKGVRGAVSEDLHFADSGQLDMALTGERESSGITQAP